MKAIGCFKSWIPAAAALLLLLLATSPSTFGDDHQSLRVVGLEVKGTVVEVTVTNPSSDPQSATVAVEAVVNGEVVRGLTPVVLMGRATASVPVGFTSSVEKILRTGVHDDPNPIG